MARQSIGQFLATLRRAHGYTQQEVADKLNVSNRAVSTWERDSSMPDILLLPVIAELYGVTVDEILNGARMDRNGDLPTLSQKAETALLRKKYARFTTQAFVLLGVFFLGLLALFFGWYTFEGDKKFDTSYRQPLSKRWELIPIAIGVVVLIVSLTCFVAIWAHAESSVNDALERKREFCILLRRLVVTWLYVAGALSVFLSGIGAIFAATNDRYYMILMYSQMIPFLCTYLSFGAILLFAGLLVKILTALKFSDDTMRQQAKCNRKLSMKISLWGLIPLCIAIVLVVVFSFVKPTSWHIYYQNSDREEFRNHMETLHIDKSDGVVREGLPAGDYHFNISEIAATVGLGEDIDMGNGFSVKFIRGPYDCVITYSSGETKLQFYCMRLRYQEFTVFDVYYKSPPTVNEEITYTVIYGKISYQTVVKELNGIMVFARVNTYDLSSLFAVVGSVIVAIDVAVCIAIYCCKRERTEIKL